MLQLLDNYNYSIATPEQIDDELTQLVELCQDGIKEEQLYIRIRSYVYREIKIEQLAVTRILQDLLLIRQQSQRAYQVLLYFTINNTASFADIAENFHCSKQNIHAIMKRYAPELPWLNNLLHIKSQQDGKGGGRARGQTVKQTSTVQLCLFDEEGAKENDDDI